MDDVWVAADAYERYMGRWSRRVAARFVSWLGVEPGCRWLDVGCGTGAVTATILASMAPSEVIGVDSSQGFVEAGRLTILDPRVRFEVGDLWSLPTDAGFDAVVSGLMLNFVPDPGAALAQMCRLSSPDGMVAAYVWDYADGMAMLRHFWDAAVAVEPGAAGLDEGVRFPLCRPGPMVQLWRDAGLTEVAIESIEVPTAFSSFDDVWTPFLGGQGPAPGFVMSLPEGRRAALCEDFRTRLPAQPDGSIELMARAWAVRGRRPATL